jgi:hypothetical protein
MASSSSLLKKGTGSERTLEIAENFGLPRGARPLFQQAASGVQMLVRSAVLRAAVGCLIGACCSSALAQEAWRETFEGPNVSWQPAGADLEYRLDIHRRIQGRAHSGNGCEQIQVTGSNGSAIYFSHAAPAARIFSELACAVWVRADRPGIQLLALAVLPHTTDPRSGHAATVLLTGTTYSQVGVWQQLRLEDFPALLERQVRVLRLQFGSGGVDSREAYVDQVWLNVYGGPGSTNVCIDDLELTSVVSPNAATPVIQVSGVEILPERPSQGAGPRRPAHDVRLDGSVLLVDGRPFFPRSITYRGEPLSLLAKTGFNSVRLMQPPTPEILAEAEREGLWLFAPPPRQPGRAPGDKPVVAPIGPEYDPVLAWHLGDSLTSAELADTTALVRQLHLADTRNQRPILCAPDTDLRAYSRQVDLLSLSRRPLGTSLDLADYGIWLRERVRLARPGTPFWTCVQTQIAETTREQQLLFPDFRAPAAADNESLRLLTYLAITSGARGIEFQSESPLSVAPPSLQLTLALLNFELDLVEPWTAAGSNVTVASTGDPQLVGFILQTEKARLLVPMRLAPASQYLPRPATSGPVSLVVPGVPESHAVYEITPVGLRPLNHERVTGGMQVTIDEFQLASLVLITPDPVVVNTLNRRLAATAQRAADLERELAARTLAELEATDRLLPRRANEAPQALEWLKKARAELETANKALAAGDRPNAFQASRRALGPLEQFKRLRWEQAATGEKSLTGSPFLAAFDTLPAQWHLVDALHLGLAGPNRLPGGDCENLQGMMAAGWRHVEHPLSGVRSIVELSSANAHTGYNSLHLKVQLSDPEEIPGLVETAPVWVVTAPVPVRAGELLAIRGFVRVPTAITGSTDGLAVIDSIGGEALAERIGQTKNWTPFVLYRMAPRDGPLTVTFALTGFGEAWIDDVTIQAIGRAVPGQAGAGQFGTAQTGTVQAAPMRGAALQFNPAQFGSTPPGVDPFNRPRNSGQIPQPQNAADGFPPAQFGPAAAVSPYSGFSGPQR